MPICLIVWKYIKFQRALGRIKRVKLNAYRKSLGLGPKYGCCKTWLRWLFGGLKSLFLRICCACLFCKGKDGVTTWDKIWTDGTLPSAIAKSLVGLIVGLVFTHLLTIFLIFQLHFEPVTTTYGAMVFGLILTLGLAFSETSRCFVFLTVPQFFTKKGRGAILAYCFILALSGPGTNVTTNMEILTESLLCSQEMAHNATQGLINLVRDPYSALGGALKAMVDAVKEAAATITSGLRLLMDVITSVVNGIKAVLKWLKEITSFCNSKVGSPSEKCNNAFDEGMLDCQDRLGVLKWMCSVVDLGKNLCTLPKWTEDVLCWLPNLMKESVLLPITNGKAHIVLKSEKYYWSNAQINESVSLGLKEIGSAVKTFFDVRIRFDYQLDASLTSSKSFRAVVRGMKDEIMGELHWFLKYMDWVNLLASLFMALALYKAIIYRHRFLNVDRHDNFYITKGLVKLDIRRRRIGKDPLFPLKYREAFTFVQPFSFVLVETERKALHRQLLFVGIAAVKISCYVLIDYVFYLFLLLVQKYGAFNVDTRQLLGHGVAISGDGFMADMYRAILAALSPIGALLPVFDTSPCLPIPSSPNYYRYAMIFFLIFVCVVACVTEPYGMRLRHIICEIYYPERKLPRARWLYTHILSTRGNFIFYARDELRAMMSNGRTTYRVPLLDRLAHTVPCLRKIFSLLRIRRKKCFLCGLAGDTEDEETFVECPSCASVYCNLCYEEVGGRCVACMSPIEFGNISEESGSDSSEEESEKTRRKVKLIMKRRRAGDFSARSNYSTSSEESDGEDSEANLETRQTDSDDKSSNGMQENLSENESQESFQSDRSIQETADEVGSKNQLQFAERQKLIGINSPIESYTGSQGSSESEEETSNFDSHDSSNDDESETEESQDSQGNMSTESEEMSHVTPQGFSNETGEDEESHNTPSEVTSSESEDASQLTPDMTANATEVSMGTQDTNMESSSESDSDVFESSEQESSSTSSEPTLSLRISESRSGSSDLEYSTDTDVDDISERSIEHLDQTLENNDNIDSEENFEKSAGETEPFQIESGRTSSSEKQSSVTDEDESSDGSEEDEVETEVESSNYSFKVNSTISPQSSRDFERASASTPKAPNLKERRPSILNSEAPDDETLKLVPNSAQTRPISASMAKRIQQLDSFYSKMPFPPLSNIYK